MAIGSRKPMKKSSSLRIRAEPKPKDKSVKKWTSRKFESRIERSVPFTFNQPKTVKIICDTAENLLTEAKSQNAIIIFIGQGMRPLFEAARGLNEINKHVPRKNLKYVINPKLRFIERPTISEIKQILLTKNVVPTGKRNVFVVDNVDTGRTIRDVHHAILSINPEITVHQRTGENTNYEAGIRFADFIDRPTKKYVDGLRIHKPSTERNRTTYLTFQKFLQEHINKLKKQKKKSA